MIVKVDSITFMAAFLIYIYIANPPEFRWIVNMWQGFVNTFSFNYATDTQRFL